MYLTHFRIVSEMFLHHFQWPASPWGVQVLAGISQPCCSSVQDSKFSRCSMMQLPHACPSTTRIVLYIFYLSVPLLPCTRLARISTATELRSLLQSRPSPTTLSINFVSSKIRDLLPTPARRDLPALEAGACDGHHHWCDGTFSLFRASGQHAPLHSLGWRAAAGWVLPSVHPEVPVDITSHLRGLGEVRAEPRHLGDGGWAHAMAWQDYLAATPSNFLGGLLPKPQREHAISRVSDKALTELFLHLFAHR